MAEQTISGIEVRKPFSSDPNALNVSHWPVWTKECSVFDWVYDERETCLFLEGKVMVRTQSGEVFMGSGDMVTFAKGLKCTWHVLEPVKKHYCFG